MFKTKKLISNHEISARPPLSFLHYNKRQKVEVFPNLKFFIPNKRIIEKHLLGSHFV